MQKKIWLMLSLVGCLTLLVGSAFWLCRKPENAVKKTTQNKRTEELATWQETKQALSIKVEEGLPAMEEKKVGGYGVIGTLTIPKLDLCKKILEKIKIYCSLHKKTM